MQVDKRGVPREQGAGDRTSLKSEGERGGMKGKIRDRKHHHYLLFLAAGLAMPAVVAVAVARDLWRGYALRSSDPQVCDSPWHPRCDELR